MKLKIISSIFGKKKKTPAKKTKIKKKAKPKKEVKVKTIYKKSVKKAVKPKQKKIQKTKKAAAKTKQANKAIIFDMDGVLVDVSESYRACIKKSAEFFLGVILDPSEVENIKNQAGFNDDYDCVKAILDKHERFIENDKIIKKFQEYYIGRNWNGMVRNERWLLDESILKKLSKKFKLAIFTGRPGMEAMYALDRFKKNNYFKVVVVREDIAVPKPAPDGLKDIMAKLKVTEAIYLGDVIDDAVAAKNAQIDFIGVIPPGVKDKASLRKLLKEGGAKIVLDNVNQIMKALR